MMDSSVTFSSELGEYATAIAQFQAAAGPAAKDGKNPHFRSRYARLEDAWAAARGPLGDAGLAVQQWPHTAEGRVHVTTVVLHKSGQYMMSTLSLRPSKDDAQSCGSAITYACRYAFMAALGLPPSDDDDGNAAMPDRARAPKNSNTPRNIRPSDASQDRISTAGKLVLSQLATVTCQEWLDDLGRAIAENASLTAFDKSVIRPRFAAHEVVTLVEPHLGYAQDIQRTASLDAMDQVFADLKELDPCIETTALRAYAMHRADSLA